VVLPVSDSDFWLKLDALVASCPLRIDRPRGSTHPRYPEFTYPLDYGYLEGSKAADGGGVDVWVGTLPDSVVTGAICTVDIEKRDAEVKILLGCTPEEADEVLRIHNDGGQSAALLMRSGESIQLKWLDWTRRLQTIAQNGLTYAKDPYDVERYEAVKQIALEVLAVHAQISLEDARYLFIKEMGHATPKVDVRGVVFRDGAVLLVRERQDGMWTLPGGWADPGESPAEATVREVFEESGYLTRAVKLLALYDRDKHGHTPLIYPVYKLYFLCELLGGEPSASRETDGVGFFPENELPPLSLGRNTPAQIARFFEHHRHPEWPADFD
jgi:ADP-ribose pyrophosphatase YjhB (NUDIX family)